MSREMVAELTNMCMVEDRLTGRFLVIDKVGSWSGITFPGGHVEAGESFHEAMIREVREETGLLVSQIRPCGVIHYHNTDDGKKYLVMLYKTHTFSGEMVPETCEGRVSRMTKEELYAARLTPNMPEYLSLFFSEEIHECYVQWNAQGDETREIF